MRARLFLLLILLLTTASFFWEDEQKLLNQLTQNGESAFSKKDFEGAKKAFEELFGRISITPSQKYQVDWHTYINITLRLACVHDELGDKEEAKRVLSIALAKNPPAELTYLIKLMKARLCATSEAPADAYCEMMQITQSLPLKKWPAKEISFFHALEQTLDSHYDALVRKAKLHLTAGLYPEALAWYEEVYQAIEKGCFPKVKHQGTLLAKTIRYRLAECYFLNANYEKSLSYTGYGSETAIDPEMLYLSALCYREKKEYEKALELFHHYIQPGPTDLEHYDYALFEMGHYMYQTHQFAKARSFFEKLQSFPGKPKNLAAVLLARIHLEEGHYLEAEKILAPLIDSLGTQDPLQYECYYLRGRAAFEEGDFYQARDFFERSLPCRQVGKWSGHSLYHLGWCYLHLSCDPLKHEDARLRFFNQAEETFTSLFNTPQYEEACLSLAQLYVRHASREKLEQLLIAPAHNFSLHGQLEALLLRAESACDFAEKETLYAEATDSRFRKDTLYAQGWFHRGLNNLKCGLQNPSHRTHSLLEATSAFEKAFLCRDQSDPNWAADILKMEAKTHLCRLSIHTALNLFEKLLTQFKEKDEKRIETLYLRGLVASGLPSHFALAEESLVQVIQGDSKGLYIPNALFALGTLYYTHAHYMKAQDSFYQLASQYPTSSLAPEGWFWAAEAAYLAGDNPIPLRRQLYENYPLNSRAAEAYFRQYPFARYLEGGSDVIQHIKGFFSTFSDTPIEIVMYYLLGLHEEKAEKAERAFEKSIAAFCYYQKTSQITDAYVDLYYRAHLEFANRKSPEESESILKAVLADFEQRGHPLTTRLKHTCAYPLLFEEAEFKLVQCYLKQGKERFAQKKLQEMLQHYESAGLREGSYLSQVWLEQGKLAFCCQDWDTALNCFEIALECIPGTIVHEQHLNLWLHQSSCYREKKEYDVAMRLLSKVINAETASPLRLKAMFWRSEIYELEERPELAMRQLEAMTKKGGEWANQAKDKLKRQYGVE